MTKAIFNIFCSLCGRCFLRFSRQGFDRLFDITSLSQSLVNENPKNTVDKDKYKDSPSDTFNVLQHNYDFFPCCTGYERFSGHRVVTSLVSIKNCYSSRISSFFTSCFVFLFSLLSLYLFFFFFLVCICYRCGWFAHIHGTFSCMWVLIQRLVSHPGATVNFVKWYFFYPICFSSNISRIFNTLLLFHVLNVPQ